MLIHLAFLYPKHNYSGLLIFHQIGPFLGLKQSIDLRTFLGSMENHNTTCGVVCLVNSRLLLKFWELMPLDVMLLPMCLNSSCINRMACSEVREFEYSDNPSKTISILGVKT